MKKILAFTLCFVLLLTALFVPMTAVAETNLIATDVVADWDAHLTVAEKGQYIRPKALDDGTIVAAWYVMGDGGHFGISYDGGVTYKNDVTVVKNEWSTTEEERDEGIYKYGRREVQNPNVIQMADGRLLYTYRFNTFTSQPEGEKTWDTYYSSIRYQISDDGGASWGEPVVIKEFEIDDPDKEQGQAGYWEPEPYYIGEDLYVYWCDTVTNAPNFGVQNVLGAKWNGNGFDESFIAIDGTLTSSRDGMCVVTTLADGSYAMVYESTDTDGNPNTHNIHDLSCSYCENDKITFVIKMARSKDGVNWNEEDAVIIAKPEILKSHVDAEGGAENVCASPYVITLPDGRLAISYQTTDLYNGDVIPTTVVRRSVVQVAISDIAVGYDTAISTANFKKIAKSPANVVENQYANAGSLFYNNGKLLAYCYIGTNSVKEDGSVSSTNSQGIKMAYIDLKSNELDSSSIDNYIVYNNSGKTVTEADGVFTLPNGCTNMVYGEPDKVDVFERGSAVEGIYDLTNYTTYTNSALADRMVIDAETNTISFDSQTRNWLAGTDNMTAFEASATIEGNSKGTIYAGFGFHMQSDAFNTETFKYSTSGYTVIVKRSTTSADFEILVRYISGTTVYDETLNKITATGLLGTATDEKVNLKVWADNVNFYVVATNASDSTKTTGVYTYPLDYTSVSGKNINWSSGGFMLTANGVNTITNFELYNASVKTVDSSKIVNATDLDAKATINFPETLSNDNQVGLSFRVQSAVDKPAPGVSGYVIKLLQTTDGDNSLNIQMTRYGTKTDGTTNANLGNMYTYADTTVLGEGSEAGASIIMDAKLRDNIITLTVTNADNAALTSTYEFDLKKASGSYSDYYEYGGFGFFKNGNATDITVSDVSFKKVAKNLNKIEDDSAYTVYRPEISEDVVFEDNAFVSNDATTKKIILEGATVTDFKADTTLEVGADGNLKGGIIFRAQNVGGETNDMDGYSAVVYKTDNKTQNYGRIVLLVYKWARLADGTMDYMGTLGSKVFLDTLNSVYPEAETDILAAAGVKIKLNLEVVGDTVTTSFDVLNESNIIAASTEDLVVDLNATPTGMDKTKVFADDSYSVIYNAGAVGLSISTLGKICDFNLDYDGYYDNFCDISTLTQYSSTSDSIVVDTANNKFYSITSGYKRAVDWNSDVENFKFTSTAKTSGAGTLKVGFDFGLNQNEFDTTAVKGSTAPTSTGYRVYLKRDSGAKAMLYFFEYTLVDGVYKVSINRNVSSDTFFGDYTSYGEIDVLFEVEVVDGNLTATAKVKDYPENVLTITASDVESAGSYGFFIEGGGAINYPEVSYNIEDALITAADCENGSVYAAINSGAAAVGDTVKIAHVANEGYRIDTAFANGNEVAETEDGFTFVKEYGKTEISATFFLVGDIAKDGKVDSTDIASLRKNIIGAEEIAEKYADINDDGAVDVIDLVRIKKISAGIK